MEQTQQQHQFQCTGDCLKCSPAQRQYCASQHVYDTLRILEHMEQQIIGIEKKISAIQDSEAMLFDPNIAQEGDGAEIDSPKQLNI